ncbi:hypothetical protein FGG08_003990 [Glutinoglossum americanum]|uniref:BTB/POZ domain-containing protein n=1 Tax=Glutinoglossum americanum TaxID=1670608 RepID=A0A9P8I8E9_9PEZI|nr:hypothetical protein FGG08_003990 [Glutinoglossum americanum]
MPIAPSNNPPSVSKKNSGSLSTALGVGRSLSAGRGGDGVERNINLSPGGSSLDTSFSIGNDQTTPRRSNHTGLLEEGLTLSPSAIVGGFPGSYNNLAGTPALFNFDWEATFDPLASTGNIYEPQNELVNESQHRLTPRQDLGVPPPPPSNSATSNSTTPILASPHPPITGGTSTKQASPLARTATKRKAEADPVQNWAVPASKEDSRKRSQTGLGLNANNLQNPRKWTSRPSPTGGGGGGSITETQTGNGVSHTRSNSSIAFGDAGPSNTTGHSSGPTSNPAVRRTASEGDEAKSGRAPSIMRATRAQSFPDIPKILPHEKVFPVQIGSELFRLSGASISSDAENARAPSYFTQFFERQIEQSEDGNGAGVRTLYIDRDPVTFRDISLHLQGYHVRPRDGSHFVRLFADAQFYSLPRLISQLFESEIFIQIGNRHFQIPRDIFSSPGDSPNFFSLGFAVFFSSPTEVFPGLNREGLLRPPSILPPSVPNRSADVFAELLHMLRGYPLHIRDEEHRTALLRDCRYFHLRGLEQKLIPHHISFNFKRNRSEIGIRLEDIRQSGISFVGDSSPADRSPSSGWVNYARPFVDDTSYELILEVAGESTKIDFRNMRAEFVGQARARISSLFQVIANKMNLPVNQPLGLMMMSSGGAANHPVSPGNTPLSEDKVKIRIEKNAQITLDGEDYWGDRSEFGSKEGYDDEDNTNIAQSSRAATDSVPTASANNPPPPPLGGNSAAPAAYPIISRPSSTKPGFRKRKRRGSMDEFGEWIIRRGQWRLRVQSTGDGRGGMEVVMFAVKLDAFGGEQGRNAQRPFLTG